MIELEALEKEIAKLNTGIDGIGDKLVSAITLYQLRYEKLLLEQNFDLDNGRFKPTLFNYNKVQSINPMQQLGFNTLAANHFKVYDDMPKQQLAFNKRIGVGLDLSFNDATLVNRLRDIDLGSMYGYGKELDNLIKKELVNSIALQADYRLTVKQLAKNLLGSGIKDGKLAKYAETYMRTSLFGLSRLIDKQIYDDSGIDIKEYRYVGALDNKTRPFCLAHLGKKYTPKQIVQFPIQNGSGLNGYFAPGGYNCRHRLIPVI